MIKPPTLCEVLHRTHQTPRSLCEYQVVMILVQGGHPQPWKIAGDAMNALFSYDWPGNMRELENMCERALLMSDDGIIISRHLPPHIDTSQSSTPTTSLSPTANILLSRSRRFSGAGASANPSEFTGLKTGAIYKTPTESLSLKR